MTGERMGGIGAVLEDEIERASSLGHSAHTAILVEGESDRRAVTALARRMGRNLVAEGVSILAIAGATNVSRFLEILSSDNRRISIVGLCDEAEAPAFRAAFDETRMGDRVHVCVIDLEDELIRAIGVERMLQVIENQDELRAFRSFQNQPDQRHKTVQRQMWRWLGNRKIRYASVLVDALDLDDVPAPLLAVLSATDPGPAG